MRAASISGLLRAVAVAALVGSLLMTVLTSCGDDGDDDQSDTPSDGGIELVSASVDRAATDPAAASSAGKAIAEFATDLYAQAIDGDENIAISPYSVAAALSMARAGALGPTGDEIDDVLRTGAVGDLHAAFGSLDAELANRPQTFPVPEGDDLELELSFANAVWPQRGFPFDDAYLELLARHYGAAVQTVDYVADAEGARQAINAWVAERTRDRITDLIPPGTLDAFTRLVLTNALYMKAPWLTVFNPAPDVTFTRLDSSTVAAPFMRLSSSLRYGTGSGWQAVELPYMGSDLAMVVAVPDAGTFADFEAGFDAALLEDVESALEPRTIELGLPKWEFRNQVNLNEPLKSLGMQTAFTDDADFSAMSTAEQLMVTDVLHEVFIAVDENGTEAAAATAVVIGTTSAPLDPVVLDVDRPFMFWIVDRPTGAVLFLGRVTDPTAG